jgi:general L-amino acid transport system substrate-binding protein
MVVTWRRTMRRMGRLVAGVAVAAAIAGTTAGEAAVADTLAGVRERGALRCGVDEAVVAGFAARDESGAWTGFDVDYCRAIAAAVLGDAAAVRFVDVDTEAGPAALAAGRVDVLANGTAWTLGRDAAAGLDFPAVTFFDGQAFLVPRALGVRSALELDGARVCVLDGARALRRLDAFFTSHLMEHVVLVFRGGGELFAAYAAGLCDAATAERSRLVAALADLDAPAAHLVLPELVAKSPRALAVAEGDPVWADVVRWVHMALLAAEEHGLDQARARTAVATGGAAFGPGAADDDARAVALGLAPGWADRAVAAVGHYGELFERHLGPATASGLERGSNALWRDGGLHYPLPLR